MTASAVEALEPTTTYEIWRRELGSGNIENNFRGVTWATQELAETASERENRNAAFHYSKDWDSYNSHIDEKPKLWYYFVVMATTTREWVKQ